MTTELNSNPNPGIPNPSANDPSTNDPSDPGPGNLDPSRIDPDTAPTAGSWRDEVALRLERYRTRRKPRTPRYPSLLLPFDAPEGWSHPAPPCGAVALAVAPETVEDFAGPVDREASAPVIERRLAKPRPASERRHDRYPEQTPELFANVIEFPRSAAIPVFHASELAEPIFDRPRIVEVPEVLPPPPALGGMLIEPVPQEPADSQADSGLIAASAASIARRVLAALVDGLILATSLAAFATIFLRLNPSLLPTLKPNLHSFHGPLPLFAGALALIAVLLSVGYEFLFVVYTGSTPGLRAARLQLASFDGSPLNRRQRCWRVLASFLSAFSAGLGYLWCVLDRDGLCWHDRITRTHVQSEAPAE